MTRSRHLALQTLCGAALGWLTSLTLLAVAAPNFSRAMIPVRLADGYAGLESVALLAMRYQWLWLGLAVFALAAAWYATARVINPRLPEFPFLDAPRPGLAWASFAAAGMLLGGGLACVAAGTPDPFTDAALHTPPGMGLIVMGVASCALGWVIISPEGCARDFSDWSPDVAPNIHRYIRAGLKGAVLGAIAALAARWVAKTAWVIFVHVADLWDFSVEPTGSGAWMLTAAFTLLGAWSFALVLGWVPVLAPEDPPPDGRLKAAAGPIVLTAALAVLYAGLVGQARARSDWGAESVLQAAELPDKTSRGMTLVTLGVMRGKKNVAADQWRMSVRSYCLRGSARVPATEQNAKSLMRFLIDKGKRSIYRNCAVWALPTVYAELWRPEYAVRSHLKTLDVMGPGFGPPLIHTMVTLSWLTQYAPATDSNKRLLSELSDPGRYRIPPRAALQLARGWHRFGDFSEARRWADFAREAGADAESLAELDISPKAVLTDGVIRGRIRIGKEPAGDRVRVGLFTITARPAVGAYAPASGTLHNRLTAAVQPGRDGSFEFRDLPKGAYFLAMLVPSRIIPPDAEDVAADRHPGIIRLSSSARTADTGTITLERREP